MQGRALLKKNVVFQIEIFVNGGFFLKIFFYIKIILLTINLSCLFFFFFSIGNKTFIEKIEHHVHDSEHFEQEADTKIIKN